MDWLIPLLIVVLFGYGILSLKKGWKNLKKDEQKEHRSKYTRVGEKQVSITTHGIRLETEILVREPTEAEQRIRELHKQATRYKGNNWEKAITCLREAQQLMPTVITEYPVSQYLRLPLFLQQAGRMKEAKKEFEKLLDMEMFSHPHLVATVYDKMRLAYQREKDYKNAVTYGMMYAEIEFLNETDKNQYIEKTIQPLFTKAQNQNKASQKQPTILQQQ